MLQSLRESGRPEVAAALASAPVPMAPYRDAAFFEGVVGVGGDRVFDPEHVRLPLVVEPRGWQRLPRREAEIGGTHAA